MNYDGEQAVLQTEGVRHSACDLCREYKVKCSGSRSRCDRCTRLQKNCTFSRPRPRPGQKNGNQGGNRQGGSRTQGMFIHTNPDMYQPVADHNDRQTSMHAMLPSWHTSPHDKDFDSSTASSQNSARQPLSSAATSLTKSSTRLQSQALFNGEQMLMSGIQNTRRSASPMDRVESSPSGNASRSSTLSSKPSELCTCMQQLTAGLFELSDLRVEHRSNAPHMEAGDFLGIHNKFLHTWERLVHECGAHMAQPQFVQLLILNIEQLVSIYNEQESWREASSAGLSGDTITVGGLVIDNSSERQAVVDALLQIKTSRLADFINHLLESFSETVAPDLPARLESCLSKLMRPRAPTD